MNKFGRNVCETNRKSKCVSFEPINTMAKKGKKYRAALEKVEPNKKYTLEEGLAKVKEIAFAKFDETVELTISLPARLATVVLPGGRRPARQECRPGYTGIANTGDGRRSRRAARQHRRVTTWMEPVIRRAGSRQSSAAARLEPAAASAYVGAAASEYPPWRH